MTNVVGYARVSKREQNPAAQEAELRAAGLLESRPPGEAAALLALSDDDDGVTMDEPATEDLFEDE